ncbi:MAG: DNA repair protein RecN [Firmicutes bacterium]|nr:DNA repair protein RecN [Bacillota bacterium]
MINHIHIKNFVLIEDIETDIHDGLNVFTGETGAGKSVVIEAVSLALGSRADSSCIRTGTDKAIVELIGELDGEEIILHRELNRQGKNVCKLNGEAVTLARLNELSHRMADIHGQYDSQTLLDPASHIQLLDSFRPDLTESAKAAVSVDFKAYSESKARLVSLMNLKKKTARDLDFYKFESSEIARAKLITGEDQDLEQKISLMKNSGRIFEALSVASSSLSSDGAGLDLLSRARSSLETVSGVSERLSELSDKLDGIYYDLEDLSSSISELTESLSFSEEELDEAISRLSVIDNLKRKYSMDIDGILSYKDELDHKIRSVENFDQEEAALKKDLLEKRNVLMASCKALTAKRREAASELEVRILEELKELNFNDTDLKISIEPLEQPQENGIDNVEILISTNKGEPLRPLYRIASGGEISRIMLAFRDVISAYDSVPTVIFDEIDSGISGYTASVVARKLRSIARERQVICITHLPQIAAAGDHNYRIIKESGEHSASTHMEYLSDEQKINEIARLISGSTITENSLVSARELIEQSR